MHCSLLGSVEICRFLFKDKSENTFINMSVLPKENNANIRKYLDIQETIPIFALRD
jgi:hypothetical protein